MADMLKDLELTRDEVERIGEALKDKEFRKLLTDYVEEIQDPEKQKIYQQEITQLEKERGYDVTFINPTAGYVIKTSINGNKKAFLNICANENIQKPTSKSVTQNGSKGLQWSLPHSLTPPREDVDRKGQRCQVFDVVFHPDTLYLAQNNKAFSNMVNNTACEAVEFNFDIKLDKKNLKFPKMQYKGIVHAAVIRKVSNEKSELNTEEKEMMDKVYNSMPKVENHSPKRTSQPRKEENDSKYTTPAYIIKHRSHIDLEEFTEHKTAKLNSAIPKELVIEINLPLLRSASDIQLDVMEKTVQLVSEKPSKYKLYLSLPYAVDENSGNAKFDKDTKILIITLPVRRMEIFSLDINRDDSGVESDHGSPTLTPTENFQDSDSNLITVLSDSTFLCEKECDFRTKDILFLDPDTYYSFPEFTCNICENIIAFTLHIKNVDEATLYKDLNESAIHVKFTTVSSGFYPVHYAFYVQLNENIIQSKDVSIETWDNNVVVQLPLEPCDKIITSYLVGIDQNNLEEKYVEDPAIINKIFEESFNNVSCEVTKEEAQKEEIISEAADNDEASEIDAEATKDVTKTKFKSKKKSRSSNSDTDERTNSSKAIDIVGAVYESSGDELSYSYSPSKCKGILKRFSTSRSISESSIDDVLWASSFENCTSLDSVIPEDGEASTSLKKTVRFNDVVLKQLYRSNSSILGQKKKNQRKARNKKRAQERRHSESELSEIEDRKEGEMQTVETQENNGAQNKAVEEKKQEGSNDIFDLDI